MTHVTSGMCLSCGAPQAGKFCERCGDERVGTRDYSIVHFFEHAFETSQLFVILNIVFAFLGGQTFRVALSTKNSGWFAPQMQAAAASAQARAQLPDEEFEKEFARAAEIQSKTWIFLMIPMFAAELAVLYVFRRYLFEHLSFSTHIHAFLLLWLVAGGITAATAFRLAGATRQTSNIVISAMILVGLFVYLYLALRRTYGDGRVAAIVRSVVLAILWIPTLNLYRLILFFITLRLMH